MVKRRKVDLSVKKKAEGQIIPISRGTLALCVLMDHLPDYLSPKFYARILSTCRSTNAYRKFDTNIFRSINHLVMIETTQHNQQTTIFVNSLLSLIRTRSQPVLLSSYLRMVSKEEIKTAMWKNRFQRLMEGIARPPTPPITVIQAMSNTLLTSILEQLLPIHEALVLDVSILKILLDIPEYAKRGLGSEANTMSL
ncbi:hypothetical protein HDU76_006297, partial [Blyttiomyces sp. JEL0837]